MKKTGRKQPQDKYPRHRNTRQEQCRAVFFFGTSVELPCSSSSANVLIVAVGRTVTFAIADFLYVYLVIAAGPFPEQRISVA